MNEESQAPEAIAVIGMSGRFPDAANPDEFWQNLIAGKDSITRFPARTGENGERYVGARSLFDKPDLFDASFFGIYPKEAEIMDPQHRVFLECAWEALEDGGCDPHTYPGMIGCFAGLSLNTYLLNNLGTGAQLAKNYQVSEYQTMLGNDKDFLPVRVSYKLNLRGPSMTVQCACSTSLVAICQAATSLLTYQSDLALAGGVSISFPQQRDYLYEEDGMVSGDGTCRAFDHNANGTVFGHGCGVVLLKRLSEAVADRDPILAVIKGWAVNNDGSDKIGFAAPGVNAQADVIALAQASAGVSPADVSYIEAHGTGTPLGDPIEVAALTKAFRQGGATANGYCALGSGKTHIGHLDCAAGVTGLIKTIQQFRHNKIPALLHFSAPNSHIDFDNSPFQPVADAKDWLPSGKPRIAGVSAFGVGGTNAHVVMQEAPLPALTTPGRNKELLVLSARSEAAVETMSRNLADHLETENPNLADVSHTLATGRHSFEFRRAIVASDTADAVARLRDEERIIKAPEQSPKIAFLFPGQGSQYTDMSREIYDSEPVFREAVDECAELLQPHLNHDIRATLYPGDHQRDQAEKDIHRTALTQPCIFVVEYSLARLWISLGIKPDLLVGHSIGEYVAAVIAGTFTLSDALQLLATRARMMQDLPGGSMLAIRAGAASLTLPQGVELAASNSPNLCTVSGPHEKLEAYQKDLAGQEIKSRILNTSHAFHSAAMDPIVAPFTAEAAKLTAADPQIPWISTCTGKPVTRELLDDPSYWSRQLRHSVLFSDALDTAFQTEGMLMLEVGPGQALAQFARQHPAENTTGVVATLPSSENDLADFLAAAGSLWQHGVTPDWSAWFASQQRAKLRLPTYPFERKSYWIDNSASTTPVVTDNPPFIAVPEPPAETPPATPPAATTDRPAALRDKLCAMVLELSGIEVGDTKATFTELGFDSLFLTQASQGILKSFGVKVTFRQLLGDLSTVHKLAKHLDAEMPADAPLAPPATTTAPAAQPALDITTTAAAPDSPLAQLLSNNIRLMQQMLATNATGTTATAAPASRLTPVKWPAHLNRAAVEPLRFGPYKPLEKGEKGELTATQQNALDALIVRYTAKTKSSKDYTAEHRPHFADPRAVSGFKSEWKELVYPIVSKRSKGGRIWDIDDNEYVDITMGFGTYFFGHSPQWITDALETQLKAGIEIGPQNALAGKVAKAVCDLTGMDRATFCNTGSEAVMAAMRLARTHTGRDRIAYFTGDYHGMFEEVLVRGSWVNGTYKAQPIAPGIPDALVENMLVLDYGDPASLEILKSHAHELAAVIVEPVQSRKPDLQPREFMHAVRDITRESGSALIFDEVVTGFRCAPGGAQAYFGVQADLATYGKVIGGGMPIGVLAGKAGYMDHLDGGQWNYDDDSFPETGVTFFAGTFVRHPLAMAAANAVVEHLMGEGPRLQIDMAERVDRLCRTLNTHFENTGVPIRIPHFSAYAVIEYAHELKHASLLWFYLRENGVHVWEGRPLYFTTAHTDEDLDHVVRAFVEAVAEMQAAGFLPAAPADAPAPPDGFPRFDSAPTTEAQREIFHAVQMGDDANCAFNESNVITFDGALDLPALRLALADIVARHPALRSTFSADGSTQFFHPPARSIELIEHDFSSLVSDSPATQLPISLIKNSESSIAFDLTSKPLYRFHLIRLSEHKHELLFTAHHMICDGWSFGMILAELATAYNSRKSGKLPQLPPAMSFAEYARIEALSMRNGETQAAEDYWVKQFSTGAPVLDLPTDRPRPPVQSYNGAMEAITLDPDRYRRLKNASPKLGGTLFATLLSSFATLLHRITNQDDIVIGVPAAGQTRIGCDELIGHCLNFLPLRLHPRADREFTDFAAEVKDQVLEAYDHQNHTFGSLLRKIDIERNPSRTPLVSVIFNIDKSGADHVHFDGLKFDYQTNPKQFVNFDLFFNLVQTDERLVVECEYNTDLHDPSTIRTWLHAFEQTIETVITKGDTPLREVDLLASPGRKTLDAWNDTAAPLPPNPSIHSFFEEIAGRSPLEIALRADERSFTYQELDRHANALAAHLQNNGVSRGTLVGICAERNAQTIVAILATLKAGGAYVPIDPKYPADRVAHILADSAAPILLTQRSLLKSLPPEGASKHIFIDDCLNYSADRIPSPARPEDLAYVIYTSGSTGRPKGVAIEHRNTIALIAWAKSVYQPAELAGVLFSTSICFDLSIFEIFVTLAAGGTIVLADNALELANNPNRDSVTLINTVPSAIIGLLETDMIPPSVKCINLAGEALSADLADRILERHPNIRLFDLYGPSEDTTYSTFARRTRGGRATIGKPISNTTAHVVNEQGRILPPGTAGELLLGGAGLARGYLNRPDLTAEKFINHPELGRVYKTGDRVRFFDNGDLQFLGRLDHQVKLRGYRIELGEIESQLEKHPSVTKAVATVRNNQLVAYVAASDQSAPGDAKTDIWENQWDQLYQSAIDESGTDKLDRLDSVIAGWAQVDNLDEQVTEWIDTTVDRIRSYDVSRIFEIGCGTGQLLSRLAPDCEAYWAADISKVAIETLEKTNTLPRVRLFHRPADDFAGIPENHFDTVIINSVAQYFPDAKYLAKVIEGAARTVKPGGRIFIGDVQGKSLLPTYHASALRERAPAGTTAGELRKQLALRLSRETELSIDPAWFSLVSQSVPAITHVETRLRRGRTLNETTAYHYDAVLHLSPAPATHALPPSTVWNNLNAEQLEAILASAPDGIHLTKIPDARLSSQLGFRIALDAVPDGAPVPATPPVPANAVTAEDIFTLAEQNNLRADVRWEDNGTSGRLEATIFPTHETALPAWPPLAADQPASFYANTPKLNHGSNRRLQSALRDLLAGKLPDYMIPGTIVTLDSLPLTPNGKVDRKALPAPPGEKPSHASRTIAEPRNETETKLLEIWKQVLGNDHIGIDDDIFALGGDSILIFQITTRATKAGIPLVPAQVFRNRTISAIASQPVSDREMKPSPPTIQRVNRDAYRRKL